MSEKLEDIFSRCTRCGETVTYYKGFWWSNDDQFMCPDGEERHTV